MTVCDTTSKPKPLEYLSQNFVVISFAVTASALILVYSYTFSFLRIFDAQLIWFIEYTDAPRLLLSAVSIQSTYAFSTYLLFGAIWKRYGLGDRSGWKAFVVGQVFVILSLIILVVILNYYSKNPSLDNMLFSVFSVLEYPCKALILFNAVIVYQSIRNRSYDLMPEVMLSLVAILSLLGDHAGERAKRAPNGDTSISFLSDNKSIKTITDVNILISTSKYTIVRLKEKATTIIPNERLYEISTKIK